jgi:hypothetical protein
MSNDAESDPVLQQLFAAERARDAVRAPSFASMRDAARREVADAEHAPLTIERGSADVRVVPSRRSWLWAAPILVAAGLAIAILRPEPASQQSADREFEALVSEWSRTTAITQSSPTDRLLALPGAEFLRGTPSVGSPRIRRPS